VTGSGHGPWLVVIDMQRIFGDSTSQWATPGYASIEPIIANLVRSFGDRVIFTRFVAPERPMGAWIPYYEQWPFALVPESDPLYEVTDGLNSGGHPIITETTFGKWGPALSSAMAGGTEMVLAGVSTDCCVLSTALAAADAGVHVRVVADACAGLTPADHRRALDAMALYGPLIEITDSAAVLSEVGIG
jgi:nicotinamidase-related amidase